MTHSVLLIGYRRDIANRLAARQIPFVVWHDKAIKHTVPGCLRVIDRAACLEREQDIVRILQKLFPSDQQFTHVIAGTEGAVLAASIARRFFGARPISDSVARLCRDKRLMKSHMHQRGIGLLPYLDPGKQVLTIEEIISKLGFPVVVKPTHSSGRQGIVFADSSSDLRRFLEPRHRLTAAWTESAVNGDSTTCGVEASETCRMDVLFEKYAQAAEVSVEAFVSDCEIKFANVTEYVDNTWVNLVPGRVPEAFKPALLKLNQQVIEQIGIEWGMTHAEYFILDGQIYFGEIALRPPGGYLMDLISLAYGFDAWDHFVANELQLPVEYNWQADRVAASVLFHPGAGKLLSVEGVAEVQADPHLINLQFLRQPGQWIPPRERVSIVAAYAIFAGQAAEDVLVSVETARRTLKFNLE